ncbi:hypothetical protein NKW45_01100 [Acetobacter orientalis]|uniref:hypothetical protein n=1 Tax=Acetobacter orientalis TaxID=146474 RepID=UPI0020A32CFF|nr:hypothetical protein [Acetobacter orientalis]MCP1220440.1 hypothetical protein [Acetobacter orientalis]
MDSNIAINKIFNEMETITSQDNFKIQNDEIIEIRDKSIKYYQNCLKTKSNCEDYIDFSLLLTESHIVNSENNIENIKKICLRSKDNSFKNICYKYAYLNDEKDKDKLEKAIMKKMSNNSLLFMKNNFYNSIVTLVSIF